MYNVNDIDNPGQEYITSSTEFLTRVIEIQSDEMYFNLWEDPVEHMYQNNIIEK